MSNPVSTQSAQAGVTKEITLTFTVKETLTEYKITLDSDGFIQEEIFPGMKLPYLAIIDPDGTPHKVSFPEGQYTCLVDTNGVIVKMAPGLMITCEEFVPPGETGPRYCTNVVIGTKICCVPPWYC